uniref:HMG box domain-containing protein n=1 Tax=Macrostomum lignano TaxID=282301 RepID=A0A1I8FPT6_9PLAT
GFLQQVQGWHIARPPRFELTEPWKTCRPCYAGARFRMARLRSRDARKCSWATTLRHQDRRRCMKCPYGSIATNAQRTASATRRASPNPLATTCRNLQRSKAARTSRGGYTKTSDRLDGNFATFLFADPDCASATTKARKNFVSRHRSDPERKAVPGLEIKELPPQRHSGENLPRAQTALKLAASDWKHLPHHHCQQREASRGATQRSRTSRRWKTCNIPAVLSRS